VSFDSIHVVLLQADCSISTGEKLTRNYGDETNAACVQISHARRILEGFICTETVQNIAIGLFVADIDRLSAKHLNVFLEECLTAGIAQFDIMRAWRKIEMPQLA
jgi:hypothetical protein